MRRSTTLARTATLACLVPILVCGGGPTRSNDKSRATASTSPVSGSIDVPSLRPVSLPDLSHMTVTVADEIRERYAFLQSKRETAGTSNVELSNAYGELGKVLMAAEFPDVAEPCYLNAQLLGPDDRRWPYYLGHLSRTKGALAKSAAFFERALQLRPDEEATLVWLGDVYLSQGRPEAAEPLFTKALSLQPRSLAARFGLGRAALATRDYARAVKYLEEALALDQKAAAVHYPLAMAYRGIGDLGKAEAHLRLRPHDEVEIRPPDPLMDELQQLVRNPLAYEIRGARALDAGEWSMAAGYFRQGIELDPANPSLRHRLGTALFMMGDTHGAVEAFEQTLRLSPRYAKAHYSLGVISEAGGRDEQALERYSAALTYEPSYVEARLRLAGLLRRRGRLQESLTEYERVIGADPRVYEASFGYAMALVRLGRYGETRDRLAEGVKTFPDQPGFAHALARVLAAAPDDRVRDGRRAMAVMQRLSEEQRRMDLGETMAMVLAELGNYDDASEWQRQAIATATRRGQGALALRMAGNLTLYENQHPCRTPWREGELP